MVVLILLLLFPSALLLVYTGMRVEASLLRRKIRIAVRERDEIARKNDALKKELGQLAPGGVDSIYWKESGVLPFYVRNRVVTVRLDGSEIPRER